MQPRFCRSTSFMRCYMEENTLLGRLGVPTDISGVVKALVSPDMAFVTGQVITVSGGLSL